MDKEQLKEIIREEILKESKRNSVNRMAQVIKIIEKAEKTRQLDGIENLYHIVNVGMGDSIEVQKYMQDWKSENPNWKKLVK